jgi:O-antigen biosynthesis protein WbqP
MSIVGPRPALYNQYELIDERRKVGGDIMRPGLTGWAQINGRDSITQAEKVRLDEFYARNCSLRLDLGIVFGTLKTVSRTQDVSDGQSANPKHARAAGDPSNERPAKDLEQGGEE